MQIERATVDEVSQVASLWHRGWHQGHAAVAPPELVASRVLAEFHDRTARRIDRTWVIRVGGVLAGFCMLEEDEVYQFYVDAAFQGQGVAAALMAWVEEALAGRLAWLACAVGNDRAARFYEKSGWERAGTEIYPVEAESGPSEVQIWRYEKDLRGSGRAQSGNR